MSIDTVGPAGALARIAAIQSRFSGATPASTSTSTATSTSGSSGSSAAVTSNSAALAAAGLGTTGSSPTSFDSILGSALDQVGALQSPSGQSAADGDLGSRAVAAATKYLGVPYVWGGTDPATGLDCSGLVQRAYGDVGVSLPRVAADQARMGTAVPDLAHARAGDLVAFGSPVDHIGIYIGNGKMVVAPRAGQDVKIQDVYRTPTAIRRIATPADPVSAPTGAASTFAASRTGGAVAGVPDQLRDVFAGAAQRYGVPVSLLTSVAKAESGFNPAAVSPAGAIGLMQLMPATARGLGVDPRNPVQAIDGAARLLKDHLDTFGSTSLALAAYNAGPGAVQRYGGVPPYRETQQYVQRVIGYMGGAA